MLKNDLLLRALRGEAVDRPPVWMMRQAGRYLPDFRKLKAEYDFFSRVQNPEMATAITIMPVDQVGVDAAILFSDILVVPQAMGIEITMAEGKGPVVTHPIKTVADVDALSITDVVSNLEYVMQAIKLTLAGLNNRVPLIGFAGAPWTIFCYLVEGSGSKSFDKARQFCYAQPEAAHKLLTKITDATIQYLNAKVGAGVHALQLFDSWAGVLDAHSYHTFSHQYNKRIIYSLRETVPVILFARDAKLSYAEQAQSGASALGLDWTATPTDVRAATQNNITLQGNFDPARLLTTPALIHKEVTGMINAFGTQRYIANLGHGILPNTPVEHALAFVDAVKSFKS